MTSRTTDPQTSHSAAVHIGAKLPTLKAAFLDALRAIGPATANEIAKHATEAGVAANAESVRKRAKELVDQGLARFAAAKICSVTGIEARTLELVNGNQLERPESAQANAQADRRAGARDPRQRSADSRPGDQVQIELRRDLQDQAATELQTLAAQRVKAVAEFMRMERDWRFIPEIANELFRLSKLGTWPAGDSNDYIVAIEAAALAGLIERSGSNVRAARAAKEVKVVQCSLFD